MKVEGTTLSSPGLLGRLLLEHVSQRGARVEEGTGSIFHV